MVKNSCFLSIDLCLQLKIFKFFLAKLFLFDQVLGLFFKFLYLPLLTMKTNYLKDPSEITFSFHCFVYPIFYYFVFLSFGQLAHIFLICSLEFYLIPTAFFSIAYIPLFQYLILLFFISFTYSSSSSMTSATSTLVSSSEAYLSSTNSSN